jgi:hypothetical protein
MRKPGRPDSGYATGVTELFDGVGHWIQRAGVVLRVDGLSMKRALAAMERASRVVARMTKDGTVLCSKLGYVT